MERIPPTMGHLGVEPVWSMRDVLTKSNTRSVLTRVTDLFQHTHSIYGVLHCEHITRVREKQTSRIW